MRFFNTAGPTNPNDHYVVFSRFDRNNLDLLIEQKKYFILHAPRQTGKTSTIKYYVEQLNAEKKYRALYVNFEAAQAMKSDILKAMPVLLAVIASQIRMTHPTETRALDWIDNRNRNKEYTGNDVYDFFNFWTMNTDRALVVFIDEIDALIGDTLISVLRQLRTGYSERPQHFPQAVCLIGVRDVRDYRIWSQEENQMVMGGSAFNIKAESLRLGDFTADQVRELLQQHTEETGQRFEEAAIQAVFDHTNGQPWLVNALAYEACFRKVQDRSITITATMIGEAREELIRRQDTHIDVLIDRLREPRVRAIVQAILVGETEPQQFPQDDVRYAADLGLIKENSYEIANPIYQEVFPRALTHTTQIGIMHNAAMYVNPDNSLNMSQLLQAFQQFYRENAEGFIANFDYKESGPHLLLMAFLQRIINGGGAIHREYALGRGRVDLRVEWKATRQVTVIELKLLRQKDNPDTLLTKALNQTKDYMEGAGTQDGHLLIFDVRQGRSWEDKIYCQSMTVGDSTIWVWGV